MRIYLFVMLVAAAITYLSTPAVRLFARRIGAMTAVRDRDIHQVVTPRLGGLAMYAGFAFTVIISSAVPFLAPIFNENLKIWAIVIAGGLICLLGALDDKWDLDWLTKLAAQILIAIFVAYQGVQLVTLPIGGITLLSPHTSLILTVIVIVGCMNAVNFIDGMDGLATGVMAIGGGAFFIYAYMLTRHASILDYSSLAALITALMIGVCLGFLPHNFSPARIFMGDSGALLLGLLLASATIAVTGQVDSARLAPKDAFGQFLPILLPVGVMILPFLDMLLAVLRRVGSGKSPMQADRKHLHHRLLDRGHSQLAALFIMYTWSALVCFSILSAVFFPTSVTISIWVGSFIIAILITLGPALKKLGSKQTQKVAS